MGAVESTPAERPGGYQPDFLTAHVKSASQMLAPRPAHVPPPASGYEPKVGTDSIAIAQAKKAQQAISSKGVRQARAVPCSKPDVTFRCP